MKIQTLLHYEKERYDSKDHSTKPNTEGGIR